jgi:hypothetical protein
MALTPRGLERYRQVTANAMYVPLPDGTPSTEPGGVALTVRLCGSGRCDVCMDWIGEAEPAYELRFDGLRTPVTMHAACYLAWHLEQPEQQPLG